MSSRYTRHEVPMRPANKKSVAGALHNPNGSTLLNEAPVAGKCSLVLIFWVYTNLLVAK